MRDQSGDWKLLIGAMNEIGSRMVCRTEKKEGQRQRHVCRWIQNGLLVVQEWWWWLVGRVLSRFGVPEAAGSSSRCGESRFECGWQRYGGYSLYGPLRVNRPPPLATDRWVHLWAADCNVIRGVRRRKETIAEREKKGKCAAEKRWIHAVGNK